MSLQSFRTFRTRAFVYQEEVCACLAELGKYDYSAVKYAQILSKFKVLHFGHFFLI